jgi:gluconolactonase
MFFKNNMTVIIIVVLFSFSPYFVHTQELKKDNEFRTDTLIFEKIIDNMNFPEGPAWDGKALYASSCYGRFIIKITGNEYKVFLDSMMGTNHIKHTNGLTIGSDGNIFACDYGRGAILKINPNGEISVYSSGYNGKPFNRPNDLAFDSKGNLYFSDPKSYNKNIPDGVVYCVDSKTKEVKPVITSICYPNGLAFSPDRKYLFLCESAQNRILKFKVSKDGSFIDREIFIDLPGGDPDGIAFDVEGNLYAAHFGGRAVYVISSKGLIIRKILTPGKKPSNIEFGGKDMKTLFLTEDETNTIYRTKVEIPGLKLIQPHSRVK